MKVEYREIVGFPGYRIGSDGSVWSRRVTGRARVLADNWRLLKGSPNRDGYLQVGLCDGKQHHTKRIGVLVCEAFHGPKPCDMECRHLNGIKTDNRSDNLRWGTRLENARDKHRHGTTPRNERHCHAKLSNAQVAEIRELQGVVPQLDVANRYGISRQYVGQLWRKKWRVA